MKISYAITVCNEHKELDKLLTFLFENKRKEDQVVVQRDNGNATEEVWDICEKFEQIEKRFFNNKGQFRDIYFCKDGGLEKPVPNVGDLVGLVLEVQNSYNGSTGAGIRIYFQRYICKNGMTSNKYGFGYMFSHNKGQSLNWKDEIFQATNLLRNSSEYHLTNFVEACGKLQKPVDNTEIKLIREKYIPKGTSGNQLPIQQFGQLMDKYYEDGDFTAWGLLNAGTSVLWHPEKLTNANFSNNSVVVDGLLQYGKDTEETTFVDPNQTDMFQS